MERDNWRDFRKQIELTPEAIAESLGSSVEDNIFLKSDLDQDLKDESLVIFLGGAGHHTETSLIFRKTSNEVLIIHIRDKAKSEISIALLAITPITKAEVVKSPKGIKGVVFSSNGQSETTVYENGLVHANMIESGQL